MRLDFRGHFLNVPYFLSYGNVVKSGLRRQSAKLVFVSSNLTVASMGDGEMVAATEPLTEICEKPLAAITDSKSVVLQRT